MRACLLDVFKKIVNLQITQVHVLGNSKLTFCTFGGRHFVFFGDVTVTFDW